MTLKHELVGTGPRKVIVMHDWMSTLRSYDPARPHLDESAFSYAFVDLRGYGLNSGIEGDYSAREAANDVVGVANALGWDRFHVVGHSMSGMIAQRVCVEAGSRVRSLVAITPVTAAGMPLDETGARLFRGAAANDEHWLTISKMVTSHRLPEQWYLGKLRQFRSSVSSAACLGYLEMFSGTDFSAEMRGLPMPALAVLGRHDFLAFTEDAMKQTLGRWFSSLSVEVIESSGHYPMAETPPYFVQVMERFLASID